jgi:hypothetical protein
MKRLDHFSPSFYLTTKCGTTKIDRVKNIDWSKTSHCRGGIIPYTLINGHLILGIGRDQKSKMLTDFGGWIKWKEKEGTLKGALREFGEETLGVFGHFTEEQIEESVIVYNSKMAIIFLHLTFSPSFISFRFRQMFEKKVMIHEKTAIPGESSRLQRYRLPEMSEIVWVTPSMIEKYLGKGLIYTPVEKILLQIRIIKEML